MRPEQIYRKAFYLWGKPAQILMAIEEMAELMKELMKATRGKENKEEIAEEIADVQIMIEQLTLIFDCADDVALFKIKKLERLKELVKRDERT